jgi:hypothetical protein
MLKLCGRGKAAAEKEKRALCPLFTERALTDPRQRPGAIASVVCWCQGALVPMRS